MDEAKIKELLQVAENNKKQIQQTIKDAYNEQLKNEKEENRKKSLQNFASNLRRYRESQHMTKLQLGNMLGILAPNYHRYETGGQEPSALTAIQIASILGITVEDLFENERNDQLLEATQCQKWFTETGIESTYDNDGTIFLYIEELPAQAITVEEAKAIITKAKQTTKPINQTICITELYKLFHKKNLKKKKSIPLTKPKK